MSVPTNLIPTKVTGLPEYTGSGTYGYMPYVIDGRTYKVQFSNIAAVGAVPSSRTIATGTGLTGGGDLSQDRTIAIAPEGVSFDQLAPSGVVAGVYGSGTAIPVVTVDAKGRVTSATTTPLSISGYVPTSRSVFAGTGLTGGGDLASDVTLAVNFSDNNPQALGTATAGVSTAAARGDHVHPAVDLSDTSQTQGALPLGRGGTGDAISPVAGAVVYSTGTKFALTNPGIAGQVLMSNGVDEPVWATVTGIGTVTSVNASGGTTGLTFTGGPVTTAGTLTLGGTLAVTHGGTGATDAATARSNLGAAASGANSDITSMSGITGAIATPDYIDFDTAATVTRATGRLWWDNADGNQTLSLGMAGGNATLQIGEEMYFRIKASSAITEGQAVMFTGTLGASGGLTGAPATGLTKDTASYLMGVATEDIPLNSWGYVTQFGLVRSFNTTGGAEAWVDGQILYYNPAVPGGLTKTVPTAPAAKIEVAAVVHAASNGSVFVRPTARFSLTQLNDVETSAASDLDLLQYNGTSGVWQHKSPSLISVGSATNLAGGAANRIAYQTGAGATGFVVAPTVANTYLEWSGSGFQWSANPLGTVTSVDASGGTTGLTFSGGPVTTAGTLTLGGTLGVANGGTGATSLTSGYLLKGNGTSAVSSSVIYDDGTNVGIGTAAPSTKLTVSSSGVMSRFQTGAATDGRIEFAYNTTDIGYLNMASATQLELYGRSGVALAFGAGGSERMRIDSSGNVGIGTTSITGIFGRTLQIANGSTEGSLSIVGSTGSGFVATSGSVLAVTARGGMALTLGTNDTEKLRILTGGDVGIGTSSPNAKLTVAGAITSYQAGVTDQIIFTPQAAGSGALLLAVNEANNAYRQMTIDGSPVVINTAGTERMRVDGAGNVGIGLTPSHALDVYSAANGIIRVGGGSGTNQGAAYYVKNANNSNTLAAFGDRARIFGGTPDQLVSIFTSALPLTFDVNGSERARFDTSGNLGIGTSSPGVKLDVVGGIRGQALDATGTPALFSASGGSVLYYNGAGVGVVRAYSNSGGAAGALTFNASGAEDARVDSSGNFLVGITGQIYPTANRKTIEVNGTSQSLFGMGVGGTGAAYILHDGTNMDIWQSRNGYMRFGTNGSERMRLDTSGNVVVGTTTAGSAGLSVSVGLNISFPDGGAGQSLATMFRQSSTGDLVLGSGVAYTSTPNGFASSYSSGWARSAINIGYGAIKFYTAGLATVAAGTDTTMNEVMRINSAGSVGIGTNSPSSKLTIQDGDIEVNATGLGNTLLSFNGTTANLTVNSSSAPLIFGTNSAERMRITSAGNVGIGATGPSYKLDVAGQTRAYNTASTYGELQLLAQYTGTAGPLAVGQGSDSTGYVVNTANAALVFGNNGTERMRITSGGLVGIAVSPTTHRLEVNGNVYTFIGQSYYCYTADYGLGTPDSSGLQLFTGSGDTLRFGHRASGTFTERMRMDASGNVGIGLTSYSSKLTVAGTIESTTGGIKFPDATTQTTKGIAAAFTQIATVATTSGTTAVFSNIPQTYSELFVAITGVSHDGGTSTYLTWRVSTDGTNYTVAKAVASGTIANTTTVSGIVTIWDYSQDFSEVSTGTITSLNASPYSDFMNSPALVKVTGGVKYISFAWNSGANFDAGSITLYGR